MQTRTSQANLVKIDTFYTGQQQLIERLAARWQDEKDYEDLNDYKTVIEKTLPTGWAITKMTRRPFGFCFTIGTDAVYSISVSARGYAWTRVD